MAKSHPFGKLAPFAGKVDAASAVDCDKIISREPFYCGGNSWRCDPKLFSQTSADRRLALFQHFPYGLEIVFARYACFLALHSLLRRFQFTRGRVQSAWVSQAIGERRDAKADVLENSLIRFSIGAEGIFNEPIFHFAVVFEDAVFFHAAHIHDEI